MALKLAVSYMGVEFKDAYHVIQRVITNPYYNEDGKKYNVKLDVAVYTNDKKEHCLASKQSSEDVPNFRVSEEQFTMKDYYNLLKELPLYKVAVDC